MTDQTAPGITRVVLENYKSIAACDVTLGPLTFLVGRNGSGKSNFLDALHFLHECTTDTLDNALRRRGGIDEMIYRKAAAPGNLALKLELTLPYGQSATYSLRLGATSFGGYQIVEESCEVVTGPATDMLPNHYTIAHGKMETNQMLLAGVPLQRDRLALTTASSFGPFRAVYDFFAGMGFYHIDPYAMRALQAPSAATLLADNGSTATGVLRQLAQRDDARKRLIEEYLAAVLPDLRDLQVKTLEGKDLLQFRMRGAVGERTRTFAASSISDGTLRALGVLLSLFQLYGDTDHGPALVAIEEPELGLHPFATAVLRDALQEASASTQVIVTSHSPDLLNDAAISADAIRVVSLAHGATRIGPLDEASRRILDEELYTVGELTRRLELQPASVSIAGRSSSHASLTST